MIPIYLSPTRQRSEALSLPDISLCTACGPPPPCRNPRRWPPSPRSFSSSPSRRCRHRHLGSIFSIAADSVAGVLTLPPQLDAPPSQGQTLTVPSTRDFAPRRTSPRSPVPQPPPRRHPILAAPFPLPHPPLCSAAQSDETQAAGAQNQRNGQEGVRV